jgi:hypothetical protein
MMRAEIENKNVGENHVVFQSPTDDGSRIGIFAKGGCHLRALFACAPLIEPELQGSCCIYHEGLVADGRTDQQLQSLQTLPEEWVAPVIEKFRVGADYFAPRLFEDSFVLPGQEALGRFPMSVLIYSVATDIVGRSLYRHRQHGFLFDPGAGWLRDLDCFVADPALVKWFHDQFEPIGMIGLDAFVDNLTQMIQVLRARSRVHIVVMNPLSINPGKTTHNYQSIKKSERMRWVAFNIALADLSRELDFPILDMDRTVRRAGIRGQMGPAHFPEDVNRMIAQEAFRIMMDGGVF